MTVFNVYVHQNAIVFNNIQFFLITVSSKRMLSIRSAVNCSSRQAPNGKS